MVHWWKERLRTQCYNDVARGFFTDQKWMDLMPCYFNEDLVVSKQLGMNLAPWNFHERCVEQIDGRFIVSLRGHGSGVVHPLIFVHYSGFDYGKLKSGDIEQRNIEGAKRYQDIDILMKYYAKMIHREAATFDSFIRQRYSYDFYDNGDVVTSFHRKLYKGLSFHGKQYDDPFAVGNRSLHEVLLSKKMIISDGRQAEKVIKRDISNIGGKLKLFNSITRALYKTLGLKRYLLLLRLMAVFSLTESQIHLLDKRYDSNNIE